MTWDNTDRRILRVQIVVSAGFGGRHLAGVGSSGLLPSTDHGGLHPPVVIPVTDTRGQDGHVHLLQPVHSGAVWSEETEQL